MARASIAIAALLLGACTSAPVETAAVANSQRGGLLYDTACGACHTAQLHWRDQRLVHSWEELVGQVGRWQAVAGQRWSARDIQDTASYLNGRFYHLPCPMQGCGAPG